MIYANIKMKTSRLIIVAAVVLVSVITLTVVDGRRRRVRRDWSGLRFNDCGTNPERPIRVLSVSVSPMPVIVPGTLHISTHTNITYDLPRRINLKLEIRKLIFGVGFDVPCFNDKFGSCLHENVCYILEEFERNGCPRILTKHDIPCHCPFYSGELNITNLAINLPRVSGVAGYIINGNYEAKIIVSGENNYELGCVELKFSIKKRNRGWFFRV